MTARVASNPPGAVGTERGLEARLLPELGERFHTVASAPLVRVGARRLAAGLLSLPRLGAAVLGLLLGTIVWFWQGNVYLALVVGAARAG